MQREYPKRPIVAVGVVVIKDGHVLLIKRLKPPKKSQWSIPGGAQELGETTIETAIREVREETAITIEAPVFLAVVDYIGRDDAQTIEHHYTLIDYAARYQGGTISAGDDAGEVKWVPLDQLCQYDLWRETEKIIQQAVAILHIHPPLSRRMAQSVKGHLRAAMIALVFGLTAYGFIHMLMRIMRFFENI